MKQLPAHTHTLQGSPRPALPTRAHKTGGRALTIRPAGPRGSQRRCPKSRAPGAAQRSGRRSAGLGSGHRAAAHGPPGSRRSAPGPARPFQGSHGAAEAQPRTLLKRYRSGSHLGPAGGRVSGDRAQHQARARAPGPAPTHLGRCRRLPPSSALVPPCQGPSPTACPKGAAGGLFTPPQHPTGEPRGDLRCTYPRSPELAELLGT